MCVCRGLQSSSRLPSSSSLSNASRERADMSPKLAATSYRRSRTQWYWTRVMARETLGKTTCATVKRLARLGCQHSCSRLHSHSELERTEQDVNRTRHRTPKLNKTWPDIAECRRLTCSCNSIPPLYLFSLPSSFLLSLRIYLSPRIAHKHLHAHYAFKAAVLHRTAPSPRTSVANAQHSCYITTLGLQTHKQQRQ